MNECCVIVKKIIFKNVFMYYFNMFYVRPSTFYWLNSDG